MLSVDDADVVLVLDVSVGGQDRYVVVVPRCVYVAVSDRFGWRSRSANRPRDAQGRSRRTLAGVKDRSRHQELGFTPNPVVEWMLQGQQQDYNYCGQVRYA